jgi:hypothetical protein
MVYAALMVMTQTLFAEIFILSLMLPQVLLMSTLASKFSKAAHLFEILIRHCSLTSALFRFFRPDLCISNFLAARSITTATNK